MSNRNEAMPKYSTNRQAAEMMTRSSSAKSFPLRANEYRAGQSGKKPTEKRTVVLTAKKKKKVGRPPSKSGSNAKKQRIMSAQYESEVPRLSTQGM